MKLVHAERNGEAFDSQLVIGVRESYVNLCSNSGDKLQIYRENFEKVISTFLFCLKKIEEKIELKRYLMILKIVLKNWNLENISNYNISICIVLN